MSDMYYQSLKMIAHWKLSTAEEMIDRAWAIFRTVTSVAAGLPLVTSRHHPAAVEPKCETAIYRHSPHSED